MATSPERLPFKEAIDFYKAKVKLPSSSWADIWQDQHSLAFIVAGAAEDDLIQDLYNAIHQAKTEGMGYADFQKAFPQIAAKYGWSYNGAPGWRSRVIYDTNVTQAYNAGREKQMQAIKHLRPYGLYRHTSIEHPRLEHMAWDGLILPLDDPWWDTHTPQNDWGCKCKKYSLSKTEAVRWWEARGKTGPDTAPPIEWEVRQVGPKGTAPRTVKTPKGIGPGFAYNPGKAWLEPHTVRPLEGYDDVLKERGYVWPTNKPKPAMPALTQISPNVLQPINSNADAEQAVDDFLDVFGATQQAPAVFTDVTGVTLAVSVALFQNGQGTFKWLTEPTKRGRLAYINLLAMTLAAPDEVWWAWEASRDKPGKWLLRRRYLKGFEVAGSKEFGLGIFEWGGDGWSGATVFMPDRKTESAREGYFDKQRAGRLVYKKPK